MDHINNELPTCSVLIGDFYAKCSKWFNNDTTNANGHTLDTSHDQHDINKLSTNLLIL